MNSSIDDFKQQEREATPWYRRIVRNYPKVTPTSELARGMTMRLGEVTEIRRTGMIVMASIVTAGTIALFTYFIFMVRAQGKNPDFVVLVPFSLFWCVGLFFLWYKFFSRNYVSTLSVSSSGIKIDGEEIPWKEISETAIKSKREQRRTTLYLVIFYKTGNAVQYDLSNFWIWERRFAAVIEFYKPKQR